jgi:hypothetical protein
MEIMGVVVIFVNMVITNVMAHMVINVMLKQPFKVAEV